MPMTTNPCDARRGPSQLSWTHAETKPGTIAIAPKVSELRGA
jgi:hypothetical protein